MFSSRYRQHLEWPSALNDSSYFFGIFPEKVADEGRYGLCFYGKNGHRQSVVLKRFKPGIFARNLNKNAHEAVILSKLKDKRIPELDS